MLRGVSGENAEQMIIDFVGLYFVQSWKRVNRESGLRLKFLQTVDNSSIL